ncbi:MAG: hypothetical protein NWS47_04935 [Alphaproteobacteria bacterium]|nr:hypothetical protein [Alphaproteobacteria bacterium]
MNISYFNFTRTLLIGGALLTLNFDSTYAIQEVPAKLAPQAEENDLSSAGSKSDKTAAVQTVGGSAAKIDEPEKMVSTDAAPDAAAISKLKIADNHRNYRTNFEYKASQKEALRLYEEIMNDKKVSPDVRARAKINYADVYKNAHWLNDTVKHTQRNTDALRLFNEVVHETEISPDLKGWAKRYLSSLYLSNNFDMDPVEARKKSVSLLEEVCADPAVGAETKGRAKLSLASRYASKDGQKDFGLTEEEGKAKAIVLLNEIISDTKVRPDLRADAKLSLAEHSSEVDDFYNEKKLKLYKEVIADKSITALKRAAAKASLASQYVWGNSFNLKKSEGSKIGLSLMEEAVNEPSLPIKERLQYKSQLKYWYGQHSDMLPSEANAKALKITLEIVDESRVDAKEYFKARLALASDYSYNIYKQKRAEAMAASKKIYKELLADKTLPVEDRVRVRRDLAQNYLYSWRSFEPEAGKDVKTTVMDLYNEILNDSELKQEEWYETKCAVANMYDQYQARQFGMKKSEAKAEQLRLYNELVDDKKLTPEQKKMVKKTIKRLEKPEA